MGGRVTGLITMISGFIVAIVGFGMYRSPHLDWGGFVRSFSEAYSILINQINYFVDDPFAFIGIIVMAVGVATFVKGVKMLEFWRIYTRGSQERLKASENQSS